MAEISKIQVDGNVHDVMPELNSQIVLGTYGYPDRVGITPLKVKNGKLAIALGTGLTTNSDGEMTLQISSDSYKHNGPGSLGSNPFDIDRYGLTINLGTGLTVDKGILCIVGSELNLGSSSSGGSSSGLSLELGSACRIDDVDNSPYINPLTFDDEGKLTVNLGSDSPIITSPLGGLTIRVGTTIMVSDGHLEVDVDALKERLGL